MVAVEIGRGSAADLKSEQQIKASRQAVSEADDGLSASP